MLRLPLSPSHSTRGKQTRMGKVPAASGGQHSAIDSGLDFSEATLGARPGQTGGARHACRRLGPAPMPLDPSPGEQASEASTVARHAASALGDYDTSLPALGSEADSHRGTPGKPLKSGQQGGQPMAVGSPLTVPLWGTARRVFTSWPGKAQPGANDIGAQKRAQYSKSSMKGAARRSSGQRAHHEGPGST